MSWIGKLYETYEYCATLIGKRESEDSPVLMPIAHTTQNAHIELSISMGGEYLPGTARVIEDKYNSVTIIPCTEKSQSRSGKSPVNHPLFDKLQYLAGDYTEFGGDKGLDFHENYMRDLRDWCASPYVNERVCAVLKYLEKNTLTADLVKEGLLPLDDNGRVIRKWDSKIYGEKRGVYKAGSVLNDALDAFIRIDVVSADKAQERFWNDPELWESFINYYAHCESGEELCYVTGRVIPCSDMSPAKIRSSADKAKLISSNDSSGFTFRGRFTEACEAAQIGYETTQKAHNALKWLISKQGFRNGSQVYVTWGTENELPIDMGSDSVSLMEAAFGDDDVPYVHTEYAKKLDKLMAGYRQQIDDRAGMVTMGLDAATSGRMSIIYYEEISGREYLERLKSWYETCAWRLDYVKKDSGDDFVGVYGTPSPKDILFAVCGKDAPDKLLRSAMQRLMPCILNGRRLPADFMRNAALRAGEPMKMEPWEYRKTLCIACALIRKYYLDREVKHEMALELDNMERSYLFGRVLAYYQYIEATALNAANEKRPTNAMRLESAYSRRPAKTMLVIHDRVGVYIRKYFTGNGKERIVAELDAVKDMIGSANMTDEPLKPTYLLGYSSQLVELYKPKGE